MQTRAKQLFPFVRTEGSLLPSDLLQRIADAKDLPGLKAEDYGLTLGETLNEAINRSWTRLQSLWTTFQKQRAALPESDTGTSLTRRWLQVLFQELEFDRSLPTADPIIIEDKVYPISHVWTHVPIHLVSFRADLDTRSTLTGARKASPHSLVQELLNRSETHFWAFVSNGLRLRVLRDNVSLTRQAFVEFDLEGLFDSEAYADFRLLWLLCHRTRLEGDKPEHCWLEKWTKEAQETGRRALDQLRRGVEQAIEALGQGFLAHPANQALRDRLHAGALDKQDYYRQLLRLIYRLIFLFVAEDRDLLLDPKARAESRERYLKHYSGHRLRRLAERHRGTRHFDLYQGLRLVFDKLGCDEGCSQLALPALGSFLFSPDALPDLQGAEIGNEALLNALRRLALTRDQHRLRMVDFRNLGSEELGSVYESLLELHPEVTTDPATFQLLTTSGNERKTTGSYYTPDSLIQCLLDSALDPVLNEAAAKPNAEKAILALKVCDPACGSGHFLIAAAHRIANRLAFVRTGDEAPTPDAQRSALRDVIGHCLFGVDLNPMAVELCKVNLWLEALEPGKPLSFLDAHIQCGNSLLGTTPELIAQGLPDEAFVPLEGDDKAVVSDLKKRNKKERQGTEKRKGAKAIATPLFSGLGTSYGPMIDGLSKEFEVLESVEDQTLAAVHAKETRYKAMQTSEAWKHAKLVADAWCAAFVWEKTKARLNDEEGAAPITHDDIQRIIESPVLVSHGVRVEIETLSDRYGFLHPHIAFPQVFHPSVGSGEWASGFDVMLGNPPWERIKIQEREWFSAHDSAIANAPNAAARKRLIDALKESDSSLFRAFAADLRQADGETHLVRDSGHYPLCGRGDINTYTIFTELSRSLIQPHGRLGLVVPSGIATDDTTKFFFGDLIKSQTLVSLYDFVNDSGLFPGVGHGRQKFCLLTISGPERPSAKPEFFFYAQLPEDLADDDRRFTLTTQDIEHLNPNTGTCAIFRSKADAELTKGIYQRIPILIKEAQGDKSEENPWGLRFLAMLHMANDSGAFQTSEQLQGDGWILKGNAFQKDGNRCLPVVEAKMLHQFTHRWGDYAMRAEGSLDTELPRIPEATLADPHYVVQPRYWVFEREVKLRAADIPQRLRRAIAANERQAMALALAEWALGADLIEAGTDASSSHDAARELWTGVSSRVLCFSDLKLDELDLSKAIEAAGDCPWSAKEEALLAEAIDVEAAVEALLEVRTPRWFMGWRDICRNSDERTVIASVLPRAGVGNKFPLMRSKNADAALQACLMANLTSFVLDYAARQKIGGTSLTYFYLKQFPVLTPDTYRMPTPWALSSSLKDWLLPRILELTYTAWDLQPFAQDCGYEGLPFIWNEERRFQLRCELDAAFFHLYGLTRDEVAYVMDTFSIVRRKDEAAYGAYRTKDTILASLAKIDQAGKMGDWTDNPATSNKTMSWK